MSPAMSHPSPEPPPPTPKSRVWLITSALSPLGYSVATEALKLGDSVAVGCTRSEIGVEQASSSPLLVALKELGQDHVVVVELDTRNIVLCQSSVAETVYAFRRLDVLLNCSSSSYIGALEELSPAAILSQFESAYFGPVNMMRAALPQFRRQRVGHIINITGTTGAMGTPGLSARAASDHAAEGLSDALAFEVAPFGTRVTVVQPGLEAGILSAPVVLAPAHQAYADPSHPYTGFRKLVASTLPQADAATMAVREPIITSVPKEMPTVLTETVSILLAIAGLENPPGRIVVGSENVEQIKERLKTVSEELEEYLETSLAADIASNDDQQDGRAGG